MDSGGQTYLCLRGDVVIENSQRKVPLAHFDVIEGRVPSDVRAHEITARPILVHLAEETDPFPGGFVRPSVCACVRVCVR